jgi:hypothetical protein
MSATGWPDWEKSVKHLLLWPLLKTYKISPLFYFLSHKKVHVFNFSTTKWIWLHIGRFFHDLIWSPW